MLCGPNENWPEISMFLEMASAGSNPLNPAKQYSLCDVISWPVKTADISEG
jgi:hypothetical protein